MTAGLGAVLDGWAHIEGARLFDNLRLAVEPGQWTCLLGGSGVGKTTILRVLAGLDTGATFEGMISPDLEGQVAYMAQDDLLLPWASVSQNVALGGRLRGERIDAVTVRKLLERVGLTDHASKRPDELSGGQRQRVALARTLMEDKPLILLDEPFSALDAQTRARMQDLAVEVLAGRTVLMVTHDPGEAARLGQAIYVLAEQGLTRFDPPDGPVPRAVSDDKTLRCQSQLFEVLMAGAA